MNNIKVEDLSLAEQKKLLDQLAAQQKVAKAEKKANRKAFRELSEEYVDRNIDGLVSHNKSTESLIEKLFKDYKAVQELKASVYGEKVQDSHTSTLEDGSASITIGYNVSISFNGTESTGVQKIKNFITSLADDDDNTKKLTQMVNTFLKPNGKTGMLNPNKIIALNKLRDDFNDETFNDGMDIILDAQIRNQNSMYVSGYKMVKIDDIPKKLEFRFTV